VDVTQVGPQQAHEMNMCGAAYGMSGNDFYTFLTRDIEEKESLRQAREQEEEKAMYSVSTLVLLAMAWIIYRELITMGACLQSQASGIGMTAEFGSAIARDISAAQKEKENICIV
jgi:hypothetical protein